MPLVTARGVSLTNGLRDDVCESHASLLNRCFCSSPPHHLEGLRFAGIHHGIHTAGEGLLGLFGTSFFRPPCKIAFSPKLFVMRKILFSEYQIYAPQGHLYP